MNTLKRLAGNKNFQEKYAANERANIKNPYVKAFLNDHQNENHE